MWVDVSKQERQNYMSQTNGCLIPGYTGHCPTLKFRFGRCYGTNTREIMQDLTSRGVYNRKPPARTPTYRIEDYSMHKPITVPRGEAAIPDHFNDIAHRGKKHILGYTGYIPGLNFRYGKSYGRAADDSMAEFSAKQSELRRRKEVDKRYTRSKSAPKMEPIRKGDEVKRSLKQYEEKNKYKENHTISPEFPPIAGYTGHIPHMKGSEASLSQRYHCAAKRGLELLQRERDDRHSLDKAADSIEKVLREAEGKYSYGRG